MMHKGLKNSNVYDVT